MTAWDVVIEDRSQGASQISHFKAPQLDGTREFSKVQAWHAQRTGSARFVFLADPVASVNGEDAANGRLGLVFELGTVLLLLDSVLACCFICFWKKLVMVPFTGTLLTLLFFDLLFTELSAKKLCNSSSTD